MKSFVQYLFALVLVLLGIALLCNPSRPAQTTSQLEPDPGANSQMTGSHGAGTLDEAGLNFMADLQDTRVITGEDTINW